MNKHDNIKWNIRKDLFLNAYDRLYTMKSQIVRDKIIDQVYIYYCLNIFNSLVWVHEYVNTAFKVIFKFLLSKLYFLHSLFFFIK